MAAKATPCSQAPRPSIRSRAIRYVLAGFALITGCGGDIAGGAREAPATAHPGYVGHNLVLILVDTLRADHLGSYGYGRSTSPNLDAFAASGVLFENARSQASCTFPSVNSILTSRYPAAFFGQPKGHMGIPEGVDSIAEILRAQGYATLALSASPVVRKSPSWANPEGGFDRGFDQFDEQCMDESAKCLHEQLQRRLPDLAHPFFLYLHYMEPHSPYRPPASHPRRFTGDYAGPHDFIESGRPNPIAAMLYDGAPSLDLSSHDVAHLVDLYDEEIAYFDSRFPEIQSMLESVEAAGDTLVAIVSDHGEEFLEHDHIKHCRPLYETQIHTPLILRLPGGPSGLRITEPVENVDLVPTLLDYLRVDFPTTRFEGRNLRPLIEGHDEPAPADGQYAFSSQYRWRAVTGGRFKLLATMATHRRPKQLELFDLIADPGETRNLVDNHPRVARQLSRTLAEWMRSTEGEAGLAEAEEAQRQLKALGYIQ